MTPRTLPALLSLAMLGGCAGVVHIGMPRNECLFEKADKTETGIRYYESSLYLLVHSDAKGGIVTKFLHLPDPSKPMALRPSAFLSTLNATFEFQNGVLTSSSAEADEAVVPKAIVAAAKTVAVAAIAAANKLVGDAESHAVPAPILFKVLTDDGQIHFARGKGDIKVRVTKPKKEEK